MTSAQFLPLGSRLEFLPRLPFIKDYKLEDETNAFLHKMLLAGVFYQSNRNIKSKL